MFKGLNGDLDVITARAVAGLGFQMVRCSAGTADAVIQAGMKPLVLIKDFSELDHCPPGVDVEMFNEPDGIIDRKYDPREYASLVPQFLEKVSELGGTPWIGAISNTHWDAYGWLSEMLRHVPIDFEFGVTVHRYPPPNPRYWWKAHEGFQWREDEIRALRSIIWNRKWGMSEFGYHTSPQLIRRWLPRWPWNTWRWTEEQVLENVRGEWDFWASEGAEFAILYQINDGPTNSPDDTFGIRRYGTFDDWKPVVRSL